MKYCKLLFLFICVGLGVHVTEVATAQANNSNPNTGLPQLITNNNIFVLLQTSSNTCFVGQPVLVTYKFYTRLQGQSKVVKMPSFSGCSVQEMATTDITPEIETYKGKAFKVYTVRKVQLTPLQAGVIVLDTATVENTFMVYDKGTTQADIDRGFAKSHDEVVLVHSTRKLIQVNLLPLTNRPANFSGVIGSFSIEAKLTKTTDTANENNTLKISIIGLGNFANIACPTIRWPQHIDGYEPVVDDNYNKLVFPNTGIINFTLPFVVKQKGNYTIPAIAFNYFDVYSNTYKTVYTDTLFLKVDTAVNKLIDATKITNNITNTKYLFIVPVIAVLVGIVWWLRFAKTTNTKQLIDTAYKRIEADETMIEQTTTINIVTEQQIDNLIFFEDNDDLFFTKTKQLVQQVLANQQGNAQQLQQLLNTCNTALYAGFTNANKKELIADFKKAK